MSISKLSLENCQIKSAEKLKAVCAAIDIIEKEAFIKSGMVRFKNVFICPDIDLLPFLYSDDPTEQLVGKLCIGLHLKLYGKHSDKRYIKAAKKLKAKY